MHAVAESLYDKAEDKALAHGTVKMVLSNKMRMAREPAAVTAPSAAAPDCAASTSAAPAHLLEQATPTMRMLTQQLTARYRYDSKKYSGTDDEAFHVVVVAVLTPR